MANEFGVRGGVECADCDSNAPPDLSMMLSSTHRGFDSRLDRNGFMSTTLEQNVAMGYASGSNQAGLVFEVQMVGLAPTLILLRHVF